MADDIYDKKQKLLELRNELLKSSALQANINCSSPGDSMEKTKGVTPDEMVLLLREINGTQQKILDTLSEINSKIRNI